MPTRKIIEDKIKLSQKRKVTELHNFAYILQKVHTYGCLKFEAKM